MTTQHPTIAAQKSFRESATRMLKVGGIEPPTTEKGWLLFSLNQGLRNQGIGKPLPWDEEKAQAVLDEALANA